MVNSNTEDFILCNNSSHMKNVTERQLRNLSSNSKLQCNRSIQDGVTYESWKFDNNVALMEIRSPNDGIVLNIANISE